MVEKFIELSRLNSKFSRKRFYESLRRGWLFLERTWILSGIQFTYFIEFFVVETKLFVSSFVNVTLMRQTCSLRSSRAAESNVER